MLMPAMLQPLAFDEVSRTNSEGKDQALSIWIMGCGKMRFQATLDGKRDGVFRRVFTGKTKNLQSVTISTKIRKRETCTSE
jgi:hypothetical protein